MNDARMEGGGPDDAGQQRRWRRPDGGTRDTDGCERTKHRHLDRPEAVGQKLTKTAMEPELEIVDEQWKETVGQGQTKREPPTVKEKSNHHPEMAVD